MLFHLPKITALLFLQSAVDRCLSNPCKHNGVCIRDKERGFSCRCKGGFSGSQCESKAAVSTKYFRNVTLYAMLFSSNNFIKVKSYFC